MQKVIVLAVMRPAADNPCRIFALFNRENSIDKRHSMSSSEHHRSSVFFSSFSRQSQTTKVANVMKIQSLLAPDTIAKCSAETDFRRIRDPSSTVEASERTA
jgi:hypothetical protein